MIVLSENGCLFDPDMAIRDGAMWGFFATWSGEFVLANSKLNRLSEKYTEEGRPYQETDKADHPMKRTLPKMPPRILTLHNLKFLYQSRIG